MSLTQHRPSPTACLCGGTADAAPDTAMTEIALALAMAFFSLMVLAMMSMAVPSADPSPNPRMTSVDPAATVALATVSHEAHPITADGSSRQLIIHYAERLWTSELAPFDLESETGAALVNGSVVLAVPPDLPLGEAVALRQRLAIPDLVVATLDEPWLARLREQFP